MIWGLLRQITPLLNWTLTPAPLELHFAEQAPGFAMGAVAVEPDALVLTFTPQAPAISNVYFFRPDPVVLRIAPQAPAIVPGAIALTPDPLGLHIAPQAPTLVMGPIILTPAELELFIRIAPNPSVIAGGIIVNPNPLELHMAMVEIRLRNRRPLIRSDSMFVCVGVRRVPGSARVIIDLEEI